MLNISDIKTFALRLTIFSILYLSIGLTVSGQSKGAYYASGIVTDADTNEPLPFASVTVVDKAAGALTNDQGIFEITVPDDASTLQVTCLGYQKTIIPIKKGKTNLYKIQLQPIATELNEVVVLKPKYSKKNNPAVDFVNQLKQKGSLTDPRRNDYYNYDKYQIISLALSDFANNNKTSGLFKEFPYLWEYVDTSEISGAPILNLMVKEKASQVHYRKSPRSEKEVINGTRSEGIDQILDQKSMLIFLEDVLREIDLYDNDITMLQNRFVSPLSRIAPDFYKFYLTDTVKVDTTECIVLSFYPHNQASFGFNGQVFVPVNDSTMFIKKVVMRSPRGINLNFINNLYISQEFDKAPDGSRLKKRDDITMELQIMAGTPAFHVRRNVAYNNHNFDKPRDMAVYSALGDEIVVEGAEDRNNRFWDNARLLTVTNNEKRVGSMFDRMRQNKVFYYTEKGLKIMFTGYVNTGNPSKFDYGPVNTTISHNSFEGWRLRAGGLTTANLSKRWFGRGYVAYGTKDRKFKYSGEVEYSFRDKDYHSREFPMHSLRFTSLYDVDQIGQHYLFTNKDNFFLSFKRMKDDKDTYHRVNKLEYFLELENNFSVQATLQNEIQEATYSVPFVNGWDENFKNYTMTSMSLTLRYAPGEKFFQTKSQRIPVNLDAPVIQLTHTIAPKGCLGSKFTLNSTEISFQKRWWLSAFGYTDWILKGGHVWSSVPFPNLLIPNANLSYTIQPESFALMNAMEFINDTYASWDVTYWANGALFNSIPLFKKLKLREVMTFKGIWGKLSDRNNPRLRPDLFCFPVSEDYALMKNTPYMELSAGIENIFKCLRLDYVWRLTYLDVPYKIDRHGLRISVHMTF